MSELNHQDWHLTFGTDGKGNGFISEDRQWRIVRFKDNVWSLLENATQTERARSADILHLMGEAARH